MASRGKRRLEEFDPLKSDSADSDYDASAARSRTSRPSKPQSKPARKRQRTKYRDDGSEDISESDVAEDSFEDDQEDEEPEFDERTGRPVRKAAKKRVAYRESDDDSQDSPAEEEPPAKRPKTAKRSMIIKLNIVTPQPSIRRGTRGRSGSASATRPSTERNSGATRRSSRIAHDETETMVALTNSGNHADIVRVGTRSPEGIPRRALKGGKGIKKPPASAIVEEEDEASVPTKDEKEGDGGVDPEIAASHDDLDDVSADDAGQEQIDTHRATQGDTQEQETAMDATAIVPESGEDVPSDEDDEDEAPVKGRRRSIRRSGPTHVEDKLTSTTDAHHGRSIRRTLRSTAKSRPTRSTQRSKKGGIDESSDFEPGPEEGGEENVSDSADSESSPRKASQQNDDDDSSNTRRPRRSGKSRATSRRGLASDEHDSEVADELAEELEDLRSSRPRRGAPITYDDKPQTRKRKPVDYRILRPDLTIPIDDDGPPASSTPSKRGRGGAGTWQRSLFSTYGPFGGAGGPPPVFGGPGGIGAAGGADSDSSDDENMQRPRGVSGVGGMVGMTPTSAAPPGFGLFPPPQTHSSDPLQAPSGTPANLGKIKDKQALADADPLGVDQNVNFDSVGGLQGHIDQLKEMVALPLLYPEIFQRFHVTPPRGVLFHGPPGTGKTLLARALASSVSSQGRKVTFYMRKGADALSKWVGEAERQLRLLFEEARKTQPSIIFFDEIDGLAPVRSSKQEQIHASIVSTLLALMDGMDGRGQVIVIGATNRPDSIDPALRRPGRFDREFYFPLPNTDARRKILDIHTKGWEPPVPGALKDELADLTKGYGGADLRALCTEAALNAVQRRYPQIYKSNEKLQIRPETINITAKDFMISVKKIVPSSERSVTSGAAPLPKTIEPLLCKPLAALKSILAGVLPQKKQLTALEEAQFEDAEGDKGMGKERMQQEFERSRVFRPRLLIHGIPGMGQQYLAAAILNHFEGLHVQSFDLPTLLSDSSRSPEATIVQLFTEVKRHKPSVIYVPNVDTWYSTVGETVISTFLGLLRSLPPTDPVLLLGVLEDEEIDMDEQMIKRLFGFSRNNKFKILKPTTESRQEFFSPIMDYLNTSPQDFPDPADRKKRVFEKLQIVPPEPPKAPEPPSKEELKAQKKKDRQTLNILKLRIQPIMDQVKMKFKKFRTGVIDESQIRYLYEEEDPNIVTTDLPHEERQVALFRPFEKGKDDHGEPGLVDQASGKFFYNMEIVTIEKRLSNGYYKRPRDFLADIKKMTKDAKATGDADRLLKANELQANVEVDIGMIETGEPALATECEAVYIRERKREEDKIEKARQQAAAEGRQPEPIISNVPPGHHSGVDTEQSSGPIVLGQPTMNGIILHPVTPLRHSLPSTMTNGVSGGISDLDDLQAHVRGSNGTSVPSRGEDVHATSSNENSTQRETQTSSFGPSAQARPLHFHTGGPASLQQRFSYPGSLSQRSAITPMAEGSNPNMYSNDASTTSSEKRMTGSSGPFNTQSTNAGKGDGPEFNMIPQAPLGNSQLPDTQGDPSSQGSTQKTSSGSSQSLPASQSSHPPVPPFSTGRPSGIHSLLNASPPTPPTHPPLITDLAMVQEFFDEVVQGTTACSVEQLEQVYSALMSEIWRTRGNWNRMEVVENTRGVFEDVMDDMRACQDFGPGSMELIEGP